MPVKTHKPMATGAGTQKHSKHKHLVISPVEYRFQIDAFTPETLPMARLAEYMAEFASMLGQPEHVHFVKLARGSCAVVSSVDWAAAPKVRERIRAVRFRDPEVSGEALRAYDSLDRRLAQDNATAVVIDPSGKGVLRFAGRRREEELSYGAVKQPGTVDGIPILIGGERDPVPVHLEDRGAVHNCYASRAMARSLAVHIFTTTVRASGVGIWKRSDAGVWTMERFHIQEFMTLDETPLTEAVQGLRRIEGGWKDLGDPLDELHRLRHGERSRKAQ
jgi:hypothetical protein